MTRSELIEWLNEVETNTPDPEIEFWISETEKCVFLSAYTDNKNTKLFIDIQLE